MIIQTEQQVSQVTEMTRQFHNDVDQAWADHNAAFEARMNEIAGINEDAIDYISATFTGIQMF